MLIGRAGAIAASKKKKKYGLDKKEQKRASKYIDNQSIDEGDIESQNGDQYNLNLTNQNFSLYQTPIGIWITGVSIVIFGIYMIIMLATGSTSFLFKGFHEGHWWQYLICVFIVLVGLLFIFAVQMEEVNINREENQIKWIKKNIFCFKNVKYRTISDISQSFIVKRGHNSTMNKTIHYKIVITFSDSQDNIEVLETNSQKKAKLRFQQLQRYIGKKINPKEINIVDESTKGQEL